MNEGVLSGKNIDSAFSMQDQGEYLIMFVLNVSGLHFKIHDAPVNTESGPIAS